MFTKASIAAAAFAALASAQTFTDCNPLEKTCKPDAAFGNKKVDCDFTQGPCDVFHELDGTNIEYTDKGAKFSISKGTEAPTIMTTGHIFFGRIDVEIEPSPGNGIVTSIVLQSADLDEIDWEWVGGDIDQVQTNYFSKGDTSTYDRGKYHPVSNAIGSTQTYSVEWTAEKVDWMVNGQVVRTLTYAETKSKFPQTPSNIRIGTWCAGLKSTPEGTREWAGGLTDFSKGPYDAYYKSIKITDYAGGNKPASFGVKEYVYGDKTGDWQSIKVVKGDGSDSKDEITSVASKLPKPTNLIEDDKSDFEEKTKTKSADVETTIEYKPSSTKEAHSSKSHSSKSEDDEETTMATPSSSAKKTSSKAESTSFQTEAASTTTTEEQSTSSSASGAEDTSVEETPDSAAGSIRAAVGTLAFAGLVALFA